MKKTLRLTLLAIAAAALLTSCDAMLESLFPDQTGQTTGTGNTITFDIKGYDNGSTGGLWDYLGVHPTTFASATIYVRLEDPENFTVIQQTTTSFDQHYSYAGTRTAEATFLNVPDGTYAFEVWYDYDSTGTPDAESSLTYLDYYTYYDTSWNSNVWVAGGVTGTVNVALYESASSY